MIERPLSKSERHYIRKSEQVFFDRILRQLRSNEIVGIEFWNRDIAINMLLRMKALDDAAQTAEIEAMQI